MTPGKPEEKMGVKLVLESKAHQVDKGDNNPASVLKLKVTDLDTNFESKVTMNLYHSSQGVHLQGGRRQGKTTSCSLAAMFLEEFFKEILKNKKPLINRVKQTLLQMDLRKNYGKKQTHKVVKKNENEKKIMFTCQKCHFKTVVQSELKRHTFKQHYMEELKELKLAEEVRSGKQLPEAEQSEYKGEYNITPTVEQSMAMGSSQQSKVKTKETQVVEAREEPTVELTREQPKVELAREQVISQVAVVRREQESSEVAVVEKEPASEVAGKQVRFEVAEDHSRVEPVSQGGNQPDIEETRTAEPAREDTNATETANNQVQNKSECLRCRFGCEF